MSSTPPSTILNIKWAVSKATDYMEAEEILHVATDAMNWGISLDNSEGIKTLLAPQALAPLPPKDGDTHTKTQDGESQS